MAYELEHGESVATGLRRVVEEQVDEALAHLRDASGRPDDPEAAAAGEVDVEEAVHEARKCCKRIRGAVRLARPGLGDHYATINRAARDAARHLSPIRDAHALLATFDDLVAARSDQVPAVGLDPVRAALVDRAARATEDVTGSLGRIDRANDLVAGIRDLVADWPLAELDEDDQVEAVAAGIARTAGRARKRFAEVEALAGPPGDEVLHQWRKRVKYSWYHACLLEPAAPSLLGTEADLLHDLSDALGDDHDLAVLVEHLATDEAAFGGSEVVEALLVLVDGTRRDLQRRAVNVAARLHAEDPEAMGRRLVALLQAWWAHGPERRAGEIADLHPVHDDLGDRTNGELRELARARDLPGRSTMDRSSLLATLRAAGAG